MEFTISTPTLSPLELHSTFTLPMPELLLPTQILLQMAHIHPELVSTGGIYGLP